MPHQQPAGEWESELSLSSTQRSKPSVSNLPDATTALSTWKKKKNELLSLFGKGEEKLMKFDAQTGYKDLSLSFFSHSCNQRSS
jgi:hypothetical protein